MEIGHHRDMITNECNRIGSNSYEKVTLFINSAIYFDISL
jgi:hypothetical protein